MEKLRSEAETAKQQYHQRYSEAPLYNPKAVELAKIFESDEEAAAFLAKWQNYPRVVNEFFKFSIRLLKEFCLDGLYTDFLWLIRDPKIQTVAVGERQSTALDRDFKDFKKENFLGMGIALLKELHVQLEKLQLLLGMNEREKFFFQEFHKIKPIRGFDLDETPLKELTLENLKTQLFQYDPDTRDLYVMPKLFSTNFGSAKLISAQWYYYRLVEKLKNSNTSLRIQMLFEKYDWSSGSFLPTADLREASQMEKFKQIEKNLLQLQQSILFYLFLNRDQYRVAALITIPVEKSLQTREVTVETGSKISPALEKHVLCFVWILAFIYDKSAISFRGERNKLDQSTIQDKIESLLSEI
jgi:hypothetical protein